MQGARRRSHVLFLLLFTRTLTSAASMTASAGYVNKRYTL